MVRHPSVEKYLGGFQFLAIINKFVINPLVYVLWTCFLPFPLPNIPSLTFRINTQEWNQPGLGSILLAYAILKNIGHLIDYLVAFIGKLF